MSAYLALLIPIAAAILMRIFFKKSVIWWELVIPIAASALFIFIFHFAVEKTISTAVEYRGSLIVQAKYYEYYQTYVEETCTETYACGTDSKGNTEYCTRTYDCSHCDDHDAHWEVIDDYGKTWDISESYYNSLMQRWHATPQFVNLHRSINYHGFCGKDGNAYTINWDNKIETSEPSVFKHDYVNKVRVSQSTFNYVKITPQEAKAKGLYDYPILHDQYVQDALLGAENILKGADLAMAEQYFRYLNGYYGHHSHVKVFVMLFYNKPLQIAEDQEAYWVCGNDNEVNVCIDVDPSTMKINWCKVFSWCKNNRVHVEIREEIMKHADKFNYLQVYNTVTSAVTQYYKPRNFKTDFDYLSVDFPIWAYWVLYIVTLLITIGTSWWAVKNDYVAYGD